MSTNFFHNYSQIHKCDSVEVRNLKAAKAETVKLLEEDYPTVKTDRDYKTGQLFIEQNLFRSKGLGGTGFEIACTKSYTIFLCFAE